MTPNETYEDLEQLHLLPAAQFTWRPFTSTTIFVDSPHDRRVYRLNLADATVDIFQADPSSELSEHFEPLKTIQLTPQQMSQLKPSQPVAS
ncbi:MULTISPECIES: hypothetical protein [Lactiplantibacillus]|uniref:Uncharacterized protein n=3 Tax=Lactiplantibacillus pentosus TaxID=1589 RepID=A0AAX6LH45_LACPE|nr:MULTISPECIES: hypothetical protein [Lactiplantibacillus]AYG38313.1 hypothetical protein CFK27_10445 [Lactiplantibacillus pentosus]AYG40971.1 hypothetical protein CFI14_07600 [Lactiplantibacillus pentosus]AYJ42916.1 hypothetical protein LP314_14035 [Lactiplantibacillus pentosus]KRK24131.1 hypothetical protein FD24_GL000497 [Lactiplantibacillus pentosus DSM 20314]MBO9164976.1 hypothetical protein [Lactiplantibacillus pentosus]